MPKPIHRAKTTGSDILVFDQGDDLQVVCGSYERWFSVWASDPAGSLVRAVDQTASGAGVEITDFNAL